MTQDAIPPLPDRAHKYVARMTAEPSPALVIDCRTAEIIAGNARGLSALGLASNTAMPYALDSAMPAITVLRAFANDGRATETEAALMFWRAGRALMLTCTMRRAHGASHVDNGDAHVEIILQPDAEIEDTSHISEDGSAFGQNADRSIIRDDEPARIIRDDSETLKEIARRIRESQAALRQSDEDEHSPAEPDSSLPQPAVQKAHDAVECVATDSQGIAAHDEHLTDAQPTPSALLVPASAARGGLAPNDIAKLAHELKTPLTAIAAAAEIMRDEQLGAMGNEKYLGYAADIYSSAAHALAVIQDMLAVPHGDHGSNDCSADVFDLTELASTTVSSLQPLAAQRGLSLILDAEPGLTPIRANATAIRQILLNLLTNALKFTPAGGDVRVVTGYLNDGAVFMVVRDTGDGIDHATLARTFDAEPEVLTERAGGGRGIGLRLVRRLAADNNAEFEIESAPGRGTIVMLAFAKDLPSRSMLSEPNHMFVRPN